MRLYTTMLYVLFIIGSNLRFTFASNWKKKIDTGDCSVLKLYRFDAIIALLNLINKNCILRYSFDRKIEYVQM